MITDLVKPSLDDLLSIYKNSALAEPLISLERVGETSPMRAMAKRSNIIDAIRQTLPPKLENTNWFINNFDIYEDTGLQKRVGTAIRNIPLGGYNQAELEALQDLRIDVSKNPVGPETVQDVRYGRTKTGEKYIGDSFRGRAAQAAGTVTADVARDGLRNIWWFINAPQALASLASLQAMHSASKPYVQATSGQFTNKPLIKKQTLRLAATAPAVIAMSTGIGNIGRPDGYKAIIPSETDPRKSADPTGEFLSRYFLGRTGRLLPYKEFVKERPDVSPDEYGRYKAYQFNKRTDLNPFDDGQFNILGALRGNIDGIHGPELNFMGKTMPALTAILPTVAAVAGGRRGIVKAGRRLQREGDLTKVQNLEKVVNEAKRAKYTNKNLSEAQADQNIRTAKLNLLNKEIDNDLQAAGQALLYGTGAGGAAAITGQALESIRRDLGMEDNPLAKA